MCIRDRPVADKTFNLDRQLEKITQDRRQPFGITGLTHQPTRIMELGQVRRLITLPQRRHPQAERRPDIGAVSYTHLDVYKRQEYSDATAEPLPPMLHQAPAPDGAVPVSYTHLDVYKRQAPGAPLPRYSSGKVNQLF